MSIKCQYLRSGFKLVSDFQKYLYDTAAVAVTTMAASNKINQPLFDLFGDSSREVESLERFVDGVKVGSVFELSGFVRFIDTGG